MSSNPFNEWPFWHYFSLQIQNTSWMNDVFRRNTPGNAPISINDISDDQLANVVKKCVYYDYINDSISYPDAYPDVWISSTQAFRSGYKTIPSTAMVIIKGIMRNDGIGGELLPIIATPSNMNIILGALGPVQKIAQGEVVEKPDIMKSLSSQDRDHVQKQLQRSYIYKNPIIDIILQSYKRPTSCVGTDVEKNIPKIRNQLSKSIPEEKAINVQSGAQVSAAAPCYNIVELQVLNPTTNEYQTVKFAFKTSLKDDERLAYEQMLDKRFSAKRIQSTEPSSEQRQAIFITPIRSTASDYPTIFGNNEAFQTYIRRLQDATSIQSIDTSQTLHGSAAADEEDEIFEEDEEENDLDDY